VQAFKFDRFFRVDESFRASTRAGLTRARSLNAWVYSERITSLVRCPLIGSRANKKVSFRKKRENLVEKDFYPK